MPPSTTNPTKTGPAPAPTSGAGPSSLPKHPRLSTTKIMFTNRPLRPGPRAQNFLRRGPALLLWRGPFRGRSRGPLGPAPGLPAGPLCFSRPPLLGWIFFLPVFLRARSFRFFLGRPAVALRSPCGRPPLRGPASSGPSSAALRPARGPALFSWSSFALDFSFLFVFFLVPVFLRPLGSSLSLFGARFFCLPPDLLGARWGSFFLFFLFLFYFFGFTRCVYR